MSNYNMTISGLFEYNEKLNVNIDQIFSPHINLKTWEFEDDGLDVSVPLFRGGIRLIPFTIAENEYELEVIKSVNITDTVIYINANSVADATTNIGNFMWIKNEKIKIVSVGTDPAGLNIVTVERGDHSTRTCSRSSYPITQNKEYIITTSPRSLIGLNVRIFNVLDEKLVFSGKINDEPSISGGIVELSVISDIEALDCDIENGNEENETEYTILEMLYPIQYWNDKDTSCELAYLEGLEYNSHLEFLYSTFKTGVDTFKDLLILFLKLNIKILKFSSEYSSSKGCHIPLWTFTDFSITNTQESGFIDTATFKSIKSIKTNISARNYSGFGSIKISFGDSKITVNNIAVTSFKDSDDIEIDIPDGMILRKSNNVIGGSGDFNYNNWIMSFFQMFGRVYQELEVTSLSSLAIRYFETGKFYFITDLEDHHTLVNKTVCATENMVYCSSINANSVTFLHIRKVDKKVLPPAFIGRIYTSDLKTIIYESGINQFPDFPYETMFLEGNSDTSRSIGNLQVGDSGYQYFDDDYRIKVSNLTTVAPANQNCVIDSVGNTTITLKLALNSSYFNLSDYVYVEYQNVGSVSGEQVKWDFLT